MGLLLVTGLGTTVDSQVVRQRDASGREITRHCRPAEWPKQLPPLDAVLDSTTLAQAVAALPESDTAGVLLGILYRKDGPTTVRLLESAAPSSATVATLLELVDHGLRPAAPGRPLAALRVRVRGGGHGNTQVERSVFCPPERMPGPRGAPDRIRVEIMPGDRLNSAPGGRVTIEAESSIDETGHVTDVRLLTRSGIQDLDDEIVRRELARLYLPALIDGLPIPSVMRNGRPETRF
jgi:hypothetical protein